MIGYIIVFVIGAAFGAAGVVVWALSESGKPRKRKSDKK